MIPKRNNLVNLTRAYQILLFNSNHCKLLLQKMTAVQARTSTQEVRTPFNFQQMRIVARSQQKISQVLLRKTVNSKILSTYMQGMLSNQPTKQQKNVVSPSKQQYSQLFQQFNNSLFPQNHHQFPNKTALRFSSLPLQNYTQELTSKQPMPQLCSQPTVTPINLQNNQNHTAFHFPASSMRFGASIPNLSPKQWTTQFNCEQLTSQCIKC